MLQPLRLRPLRLAQIRPRRPIPQHQFTPEEEESILRKAAGATVGSLSMASAALDVPGGAIRNVLSGRAPSINPLSWEGRTTGRELLEQYGVLGPNRPGFLAPGGQWYDPTDWDWGDIAGLGTEIALDPWTYFTFGGAAVSRAGKAMKAAGLWDFLPGAAAKAGVKGRMATRMKMTPRMVLKELPKDIRGPAARQFVTQARQQGVRAATLADEPLGGAARFWPTGAVVGRGRGPSTGAFHGSPLSGLTEIRPSGHGDFGAGVYFGPRRTAETYGPGHKAVSDFIFGHTAEMPPAGHIYELDFVPRKPLKIKTTRQYEGLLAAHGDSDEMLAKWARGKGHDSIYNYVTGEHIAFTKQPIRVRQPGPKGISERIASALDPIGEAIRYGKYSPVRPAYAAFSKPLGGYTRADIQRKLAAKHVETKFAEHAIEHNTLIHLSKLREAGELTPEAIRTARYQAESPVYWQAKSFIDELPPGPAREATDEVRREVPEILEKDQWWGLDTGKLDEIDFLYSARRLGKLIMEDALPEETRLFGHGAALSARHASQISRKGVLKRLDTTTINDLSEDLLISGTADRLALGEKLSQQSRSRIEDILRGNNRATVDQLRRNLQNYIPRTHRAGGDLNDLARHLDGLGTEDAAKYLWENYRAALPKGIEKPADLFDIFHIPKKEAREIVRDLYPTVSREGVDLHAAARHIAAKYWKRMPADFSDAEYYELATRASRWNHRHALTKTPLFPHHPILDHHHRKLRSLHAQAGARVIYDMLGEGAEHAQDISSRRIGGEFGARTSLAEVLDGAGLSGSGAEERMLEHLSPNLLKRFDRNVLSNETVLKNIYVDKHLADDLAALGRFHSDPQMHMTIETGLGAAWDSVLQFFKGHVTAYWPAFISRNFFSGQIQNQLGGAYGLNPFAADGMATCIKDIGLALRGHDIPNVLNIPIVRAAGIRDSHEATRYVLAALGAGQLGGRYQMEHTPRFAARVAQSAEEMLGAMPGEVPTDFWSWLPRNWESLKPWAMWGVGGRERSQFFASRFGEDMGYFTETLNRFAPALAMLRRGVDPMAAVDRIKLLQVDYLTQAIGDKYMRRAVPFWRFVSAQSKYLATELTQRPGGPLAQTIRTEAALQRGGLPPALPEHIKRTAAIPLPGEPIGGGVNVLTSLGMMHEDPLQFLGGVTTRGVGKAIRSIGGTAWGEMLSRLGPQISVPIELGTGRSLWQAGPRGGRALVDQYGHVGGLIGQALGRQVKLPPILEETPQILGAGRWLSSAGKITDPRKTPVQKAINLLTGAHLATVSPKQQERVIQESVEEMMVDLGAREFKKPYFPDWFMSGLPPAAQQKRKEVEAIQRILDRRWRERGKRKATTAL